MIKRPDTAYLRRSLLVGISRNQACIDREPFTADQPGGNTGLNNTLKHTPEDVAVTEPFVVRENAE